ncbi:MAG: prepilin peptidase [Planctomycetaceae bacterium]|nr:prepilin peptidase [Planctomycetaceae bacterium]
MATVAIIIVGALVAGQVNRAIYGLAWNRRAISPWSPVSGSTPARTWLDCVPVIGWWRLRRETDVHGDGFWLRPALIELVLPIALAMLYRFEISGGLLPIGHAPVDPQVLRAQFASHAVLIVLMTVASFIDLDEKLIPDEITLPGTLCGLLLAAWLPSSLLPAWTSVGPPPYPIERLLLSTPRTWSESFNGIVGLGIVFVCVVGWWYALLPKVLWYRGGVCKFWRYLLASIFRNRGSWWLTLLGLIVGGATLFCWSCGGPAWQSLLSAWVGVAVGGGAIWMVRIVGSLALRQEAMGFGDVTLMGMIGAFMGWQTSLLVFFVAPFTGLLIAVAQWLFTRRKDIPYGPFLCSATLIVIVFWPIFWSRWGFPIFVLGWLLPVVLAISLLVLAVMLLLLQRVKAIFANAS